LDRRSMMELRMGRKDNGPVTISIGITNGNGNGKAAIAAAAAQRNEAERERRARRLRQDGWSYRRISVALDMTYAAVCRLLDGEEARSGPLMLGFGGTPRRRDVPSLRPAVAFANGGAGDLRGMMIEDLAAQTSLMHQRIDSVLVLCDGHRQQLAKLERSMVAVLQTEHRALGQRLQSSIRLLLERMLPGGMRARFDPGGETNSDSH
jgi:hypothetical protein